MDKHVRFLIGICQKAGKLVSGETGVEKALQNGSACLVILGEDASDNTRKKFEQKTFYYKVPCSFLSTREELGAAIGKSHRAVLCITDQKLAEQIMNKIGC